MKSSLNTSSVQCVCEEGIDIMKESEMLGYLIGKGWYTVGKTHHSGIVAELFKFECTN